MVAVGDELGMVRSTNGGATWHALQASDIDHRFAAIWMADPRNAIIVADGGIFRGIR